MPIAFTSCKDYQDDIDKQGEEIAKLQKQVDALEAALAQAKADCQAATQNALNAANQAQKDAELAKQAAAQAKVEAIEEAVAQCKKLMADGYATKDEVADLANKIAAIQGDLNTLTEDVNEAKSTIAQLEIQIKALENFKALTGYDNVGEAVKALQGEIQKINSKLDQLATTDNVEAAKQELKQYCDAAIKTAMLKVSSVSANLVTLLTTQLRSLVFIPDFYVNGIEASLYDFVQFKAMTATAATLTTPNHNGVSSTAVSPGTDWNYGKNGALKEIDPICFVNYNLNPATAVVKVEDLSFNTMDRKNLTRATLDGMNPESATTLAGDVKVGYTAPGSKVYALAAPDCAMFALEAKVPNMVVDETATEVGSITSDYGMLLAEKYTPLAIAYNKNIANAVPCNLPNSPELYPTLKDAIENAPSLEVAYNSTLDILPLLCTHYGVNDDVTAHKVWNTSDLEKYGLSYDFFPIQYKIGSNVTSDTKFIDQNLGANGTVNPCGVTAAGEPDGTDTKASIDKNPIVRVRLMHGSDVVLVGFVKLNIVDEAPAPIIPVVVEPGKDFGSVDFSCAGSTGNAFNWSEVTNWIYQELNISKDDFATNYTPVKTGGEFVQYVKSGNNFNALSVANFYGTVTENTDPTGATTNILKWDLSVEDLQRIYELTGKTIKIYVKYEPKAGSKFERPVYVPMTITVKEKPQGTLVNKAQSAWFRNQEVNLFNVPQPSYNCNPSVLAYNANLNNAWYTGTTTQVLGPKLSAPVAGYTAMKWYFTADQIKKIEGVVMENGQAADVVLSVAASTADGLLAGHSVSVKNMGNHALLASTGEYNNDALYANGVKIATLDQATGVLSYENNPTSRALLNHYGSGPRNNEDRTDAQLAFNVGVCYYNPACDVALKLTNGQYDVVALRPINVESVTGKYFQDAHANGSVIELYDLLQFSDWRFFNFEGVNTWLFGYYGVESISIDTDAIRSDYAGPMGINPAVNSHFVYAAGPAINYPSPLGPNMDSAIEALVRNGLGTLTWNNQDLTVSEFNVEIPVVINYAWGKIFNTTIYAKVKHTYTKR